MPQLLFKRDSQMEWITISITFNWLSKWETSPSSCLKSPSLKITPTFKLKLGGRDTMLASQASSTWTLMPPCFSTFASWPCLCAAVLEDASSCHYRNPAATSSTQESTCVSWTRMLCCRRKWSCELNRRSFARRLRTTKTRKGYKWMGIRTIWWISIITETWVTHPQWCFRSQWLAMVRSYPLMRTVVHRLTQPNNSCSMSWRIRPSLKVTPILRNCRAQIKYSNLKKYQ